MTKQVDFIMVSIPAKDVRSVYKTKLVARNRNGFHPFLSSSAHNLDSSSLLSPPFMLSLAHRLSFPSSLLSLSLPFSPTSFSPTDNITKQLPNVCLSCRDSSEGASSRRYNTDLVQRISSVPFYGSTETDVNTVDSKNVSQLE